MYGGGSGADQIWFLKAYGLSEKTRNYPLARSSSVRLTQKTTDTTVEIIKSTPTWFLCKIGKRSSTLLKVMIIFGCAGIKQNLKKENSEISGLNNDSKI